MSLRAAVPLVLLVHMPFAVGCESSPKDRLQGRWVGEQVEQFSPAQVARALGWARGASFEFRGNRVTVSIPAESPRQGTFRVSQAAADQLRVSFVRPQGVRDEVAFEFDGDETLRWLLEDGRSIVMRKVND